MATVTGINEIDHGLADTCTTPVQKSVRRWTVGLFVSAVLGAVLGLGGLVLGFLTICGLIVPSTSLYTIGTVLIGASFILFGLAAHCIDRADAARKSVR